MSNPSPAAEAYDFRQPLVLAKEHVIALERAMETVARHWANRVSAKTGAALQLTFRGVSMAAYDDHIQSLPENTELAILGMAGEDSKLVIELNARTVLSWIVSMLGGRGDERIQGRALTRIERLLLRQLLDEISHAIEYALDGVLDMSTSLERITDSPETLRLAKADDAMVVLRFEVRGTGHVAETALVLPAEYLVAKLGGRDESARGEDSRELIAQRLADAPVTLELRLDDTTIRPAQLLSLREGDIIPLRQSIVRPVAVTVADRRIADAAVGASGARLAFTVTSTATKESRR